MRVRQFLTAIALGVAQVTIVPASSWAAGADAASSGQPIALGGGLSVTVPAAARGQVDAALTDTALADAALTGAADDAELADVLAGVFLVHAGQDAALLSALARYALSRAPNREAAIAEAVRLAQAPASSPPAQPAGVAGELGGQALAEAGLSLPTPPDSFGGGAQPADAGDRPVLPGADAAASLLQPEGRRDPAAARTGDSAARGGPGDLGDTYRTGTVRSGGGGGSSVGGGGGGQVSLSSAGGGAAPARTGDDRAAELAELEAMGEELRSIFDGFLDDTAPPPPGGAVSPVLP